MTTVNVPLVEEVRKTLMNRARYSYPMEACGFIMNSADPDTGQWVLDVPNVSKRPRHSFEMDHNYQLLAVSNEDVIYGMWHTHPSGPDGPSDTDVKFAPPGLRCFVATRNGVFEYEWKGMP